MNAFWLLCVTLSLAVFFIGSAAGILLANVTAWMAWRLGRQGQLLRSPGLLFSIRVLPLASGAALSVGFALPSFLLLEPKRSVESPEWYLIALAILALTVVVFLMARGAQFVGQSQKTLREWSYRAELLPLALSVPVYQVQRPESLIAVAGIFRPSVYIGKAAFASLTSEELQAAIAHELAHVRSLDNLKQLVLRITRVPRFLASLAKMDAAWSAATELLADANALRHGTSALALSSAIVKVGRLKVNPIESLPVAACHLIPPDGSSSALAVRIQHLHDALEMHSASRVHDTNYCWTATLLAGAIAYLLVLPTALPIVHRWMEWLVK
jgi:Zn-dependent protease with chaperone function